MMFLKIDIVEMSAGSWKARFFLQKTVETALKVAYKR